MNRSTHNSEETDMPLTKAQREEHITFITTNCSCWKGKDDAKVLNAFPDDKLVEIREHVEDEVEEKLIANAARTGFTVNGVTFTINDEGQAVATKGDRSVSVTANAGKDCAAMMSHDTGEEVDKKKKPAKKGYAMNEDNEVDIGAEVKKYLQSLSPTDHLALLPEGVRAAVTNSLKMDRRARDTMIAKLTANVSDPAAKSKHAARYAKWTTEDLEAEVELRGLSGLAHNGDEYASYWGGAGGGYTPPTPTVNENDVLPLPGDPGYLAATNDQ